MVSIIFYNFPLSWIFYFYLVILSEIFSICGILCIYAVKNPLYDCFGFLIPFFIRMKKAQEISRKEIPHFVSFFEECISKKFSSGMGEKRFQQGKAFLFHHSPVHLNRCLKAVILKQGVPPGKRPHFVVIGAKVNPPESGV